MLYLSLVDLLFIFVGVLLGMFFSFLFDLSGQRDLCEDCIIEELIKERRTSNNE